LYTATHAEYKAAGLPAKPCDSNTDDDNTSYRWHSSNGYQNYHWTSKHHKSFQE